MMKSPLDGLALGLAIGAIAMCVLFGFLEFENLSAKVEVMDLATLIVPIFGAYLAVLGISKQIQHSIDRDEMERLESLTASKVGLQAVLPKLIELARLRSHAIATGEKKPKWKPWKLSRNDLGVIKDCLRYSDGRAKVAIRNLLALYHIFLEGWDTLPLNDLPELLSDDLNDSEKEIRQDLYDGIFEWCVVGALAEGLMGYALGDTEPRSTEQNRIHVINLMEALFTHYDEEISQDSLAKTSDYTLFVQEVADGWSPTLKYHI